MLHNPTLLGVFLGLALIEVPLLRAAGPRAEPPAVASAPASAPRVVTAPSEFMDGYYLRTCGLCNMLLGARGEAVEAEHDGRRLRFCGQSCRSTFDRDPRAGLARIDAAMIADQLPHYPLTTSLVDQRPLGTAPLDFIWGNRLFRAVDEADRDRILADPVRAIRALDRAVLNAQRPTYGMPDKCPVQGDILPDDPRIDLVIANRMVRVCCTRCVRVVKARPYQYLAMVEFANNRESSSSPTSARAEPTAIDRKP